MKNLMTKITEQIANSYVQNMPNDKKKKMLKMFLQMNKEQQYDLISLIYKDLEKYIKEVFIKTVLNLLEQEVKNG